MNNSSSSSISALVPGGVVTTQNISTVIKPKENNNSMQFVKIQTPELSKKAVEQIKIAQESKISKDKIKEVEEEWQSNLLNWKSKRRQQFVGTHSNDNQDEQNNNQNDANENGRKIKTFAEMIEERTKTGNRLNFHLERYIGSSESDNYESEQDYPDKTDFVDKEFSQLSLNSSDKNLSNQLRNRAHQSEGADELPNHHELSNGGDQIHSSNNYSKFLPERSDLDHVRVSNNGCDLPSFDQIDHEANGVVYDEDDNLDHTKPINSTFKQGVEQPPSPLTIHSDDRIRPMLDVDTRTKEVSSTARFEDNASDHEEEEDEQEEEQKHLQRIAFVAKLKAFEKMTKPTMHEPKFVASKINKAPPPPPPIVTSRPTQIAPNHQSTPTQVPPQILTPPIRQRQQSLQQQITVSEKIIEPPMSNDAPAEVQTLTQPPEIAAAQEQLPSPPPTRPQISHKQNPPVLQKQPIPQEAYPTPPIPPMQPARKQPPHPIPPTTQPNPTTSSPRQQQVPSPLPLATQSPIRRSNSPPPMPNPASPRQQPYVQQTQQQQQQAPPRHQSQQQPQLPYKDEKSQDRTVLSVSGKKRCSSCKEELGRGAAAFVIESLSLVYHTNCFRCSVCHVNLSNGFRGVDVRVHAGALHCQNCYSKDGLNYSRV